MPRKLRQTNQKARGRQQIATDGLHNNVKNSLHGPKVTEAVPSPAGPVKIFDPTQPLQPTGNTENAPLPTAAAPQLAQPYPAAAVHGYSDGCGENEQRAPAVDGSQYYAQYGHPTGDVGEQYSQQGAPVVQYDQYQWSQQCGYANPAQGYAGEQTHPAAYPLADPQQQKGDISQQSWPNTDEGVDGLAGAQQHSWHAYQYGDWHGQEIRAAAGANFQQPAQGPTSGDPSPDQYAPQDAHHGQEPLPTAGEYASGYVEGVSAADACPQEWGQGYEQRTYPEPVPQHTEDTVAAAMHNDAGTSVQAEARSFDAGSVDYWGNIGSGCEPAAVVETPAVEEPAELHQLPVITQADAQINTASTFFGRSSSESEFEFISKENEDGGGAGEAAAVAPLGYTLSCHSSISNSSLQTINLSRRESCEQVAADARLDPAAGHDGNHLSLPDGQNGQRHHRSNSEPFDHEEAAAREEGGRDLPLAPHPPPVDFFLPSLGGTPTAESHESAPAQFAGEDSSALVGSSATAGVAIEAATAFTGEAASPSPIPDHNIESTADAMQETKPSIAMLSQSSESQQSEGSAASHVSATCHPGEAIQGEPSAIDGIAEQTGARLDVAAEEEKQAEGEEEEGVPAYHAHPSYTQEKIRSAFPEAMQPTSLLPAADVCAATPIIFSPPQLGNILTYQTPSPVASVSPARDSSAQYDCDVMQPPHLATPAGTVPFGIPSESVDNRQDAVDSRRVPAPGGDGGMPYAVPSVPQPAALPQVEQSGFPPQPILQPMQSAVFVPEPAGASMDVIVSSSHDASLDGVTPIPAFAPQPPEPAVTIRHVPGNGIGHAFAPYERPPDLVAPAKHEADDRRQAGANGEIEKPRSERPEEDGRRADGRYRDERRSDRDGDRSEREYKRRDDDRRYDRDGKRDHRDDRRQDRDYRRRDGDDRRQKRPAGRPRQQERPQGRRER
ncbi:PREDICTED: uncharacterized protein LOC106810641 [Priapulus caudatus]|uniref:Uncharacterized protein LOC106810641 n=1 Tax=Priapulus caudatus TaxID=37621 RepID=A0ABM1EBI1_PRICU|nr:PREDICTED: uncharacterized protein LOC106810641 [Priapulus caudatus]